MLTTGMWTETAIFGLCHRGDKPKHHEEDDELPAPAMAQKPFASMDKMMQGCRY